MGWGLTRGPGPVDTCSVWRGTWIRVLHDWWNRSVLWLTAWNKFLNVLRVLKWGGKEPQGERLGFLLITAVWAVNWKNPRRGLFPPASEAQVILVPGEVGLLQSWWCFHFPALFHLASSKPPVPGGNLELGPYGICFFKNQISGVRALYISIFLKELYNSESPNGVPHKTFWALSYMDEPGSKGENQTIFLEFTISKQVLSRRVDGCLWYLYSAPLICVLRIKKWSLVITFKGKMF